MNVQKMFEIIINGQNELKDEVKSINKRLDKIEPEVAKIEPMNEKLTDIDRRVMVIEQDLTKKVDILFEAVTGINDKLEAKEEAERALSEAQIQNAYKKYRQQQLKRKSS